MESKLIDSPRIHRLLVGVLVVFGLGVPLILGLGVVPDILFPLSSLGIMMTFYPLTNNGETETRRQNVAYATAECTVTVAMCCWVFFGKNMNPAMPDGFGMMNVIIAAVCIVFLVLSWYNEALGESTPEHWILLIASLGIDVIMILHNTPIYFAMVLMFFLHQHPALDTVSPPKTTWPLVMKAWWGFIQLVKVGAAAVFMTETIRKKEWAIFGIGLGAIILVGALAGIKSQKDLICMNHPEKNQ